MMMAMLFYIEFFFLLFFLAGCSHIGFKGPKPNKIESTSRLAYVHVPLDDAKRKKIVLVAQKNIGHKRVLVGKKRFRADCSGTIRGIFYEAKVNLGGIIKTGSDNDVKMIYRFVKKYGQIKKNNPKEGDLVFFHNTYDKRRSGRLDSALTHVGLVEMVSGGTVHFIHHMGQTIIRSKMTLDKKDLSSDPKSKQRLNHILRKAQGNFKAYNAAELFAGFGEL